MTFKILYNCVSTMFTQFIHSMSDRWADLYGECLIDCFVVSDDTTFDTAMTCKLEFLKYASGYWSSGKRHEVQGTIFDKKGESVHRRRQIFHEQIFRVEEFF